MAKIRVPFAGPLLGAGIRGVAASARIEVEDRAGVIRPERERCIWAFWHNRIFLVPYLHHHWFPHIRGTILSSPSGDGQIIADVCAQFGFEAARGSSSKPKQGLKALMLMASQLKKGYDIGITPDGPRGPKYEVQPGVIKLAQLTGAPIIPMRVDYGQHWTFNTWDQFQLPKPGTAVKVTLEPLIRVPRQLDEEGFEQQRQNLQQVLLAGEVQP